METLLSLTGMEELELRALKHVLPAPTRGLYPLAKTLAALFKHFREQNRQLAAIRAEDLVQMTGLSDRRHRQLAAEGFFPPPEKGFYQTVPALVGIVRFYRTSNEKESIQQARKLLIDAQREDKQLEIARKKGQLKPIAFFASKTFELGEEIKATLNFQLTDRLPAINAGLDAAAQRGNNRKVFLLILARLQEFAKSWT